MPSAGSTLERDRQRAELGEAEADREAADAGEREAALEADVEDRAARPA